ncbi:hypothetical protein AB0134_27515, partial [Klebsiella pneumoniae]
YDGDYGSSTAFWPYTSGNTVPTAAGVQLNAPLIYCTGGVTIAGTGGNPTCQSTGINMPVSFDTPYRASVTLPSQWALPLTRYQF